jgi:hypothetical protein
MALGLWRNHYLLWMGVATLFMVLENTQIGIL